MADQNEFVLWMLYSDFDLKLIPESARELGTKAFEAAVTNYYEDQLREVVNQYSVTLQDNIIRITWAEDPLNARTGTILWCKLYESNSWFVYCYRRGPKVTILRTLSVLAGTLSCGILANGFIYNARSQGWLIWLAAMIVVTSVFWIWADNASQKAKEEEKRKEQQRQDRERGKYAKRKEYGRSSNLVRWTWVSITGIYWFIWLDAAHAVLASDYSVGYLFAGAFLLLIGVAAVYGCSFVFISGPPEDRPTRAGHMCKGILLFWISPAIGIIALTSGYLTCAVVLIAVYFFFEIQLLRKESSRAASALSGLQSHCTSAEISVSVDLLLRHPVFVEAYEVASQRSSLPDFKEWASTIGDALIAEAKRLCGTPDYVRPQFNPKEEYGSRCLIVRVVQRGDSRLIVNGVETDSVKLSLSVDLVQRGDSRLIVNGVEADTKTSLLVDTKNGDATSSGIILPASYSRESHREWGFKLSVQLRIVNGIVVLAAGPFSDLEGMFNCSECPLICRIPIMYSGRSVLFTFRTLGFDPNFVEMSHGGQPEYHGVNAREMSAKYEAARMSRIMPEAMTPAEVRDARLWQEEQLAAALSDGLVKTKNLDPEDMRWRQGGHPCDDQSITLYSGFLANKEPILRVFSVDHNNNHAIYWDTWRPHDGPR